MNTTLKRTLVIGGAVVLVAAGLIFAATRPKHGSGAPPSPEVEVVQVEQKDVPIYGEWIGTLDGFTNADVRAQVTGYLMRQGYQEGAFVKQGQLLFQIDPRPFQAALDQAEGQLAQARANLANAKAQQGRTQLDVDRYTPLAREQAASQQDLDNAVQNNLAAKATVQTAEAQIKTDDAAVETAKINLDFTRLIAPIDGIAGQAQLQVGALVNPSSGPVTSVSTVDPIKVYFTVSESEYLDWNKRFPTETTRRSGGQESAPPTDSGRRFNLSARRYFLLRGPPSECGHRGNSDRWAISQSGEYSASRRLRQNSHGRSRTERCVADTAACSVRTARGLSSGCCGWGEQSQHKDGQGRRPSRLPMDYC